MISRDWMDLFWRILGEEIRRRRKAHGWKQRDLLERLDGDSSLSTYASYEQVTREMTLSRLLDIAHALDTTPAEILANVYEKVFGDPEDLNNAKGWTIDLSAAVRRRSPELLPLRNWARVRLAELAPDQPQTAWLPRPALNHLAELCGLEPVDLVKRLPRGEPA